MVITTAVFMGVERYVPNIDVLSREKEDMDKGRNGKIVIFKDAIRKVGENGLCVPLLAGIKYVACNENRNFSVKQPEINYPEILEGFIEFFPKGTEFVGVNEFEDKAEASLQSLEENDEIAYLTKRAHLPLPFPHHEARNNYGQSLQEFYIPVVERAYKTKFPEREFNNYCDGKLTAKVSVISNLGHDKLLTAMAEGPGVAWYFPHPLQGFSVDESRKSMVKLLPHNLMLGGAIEPSLGLVGFTKEMAGILNTPGYNCSAVWWRHDRSVPYYGASSLGLRYCDGGGIYHNDSRCSSALVLLA